MSMKPVKPMPGKQPSANVNVNIADTETITCEDCGNASFIQSFFLRRLSPLVSPNGQEGIIPIQVFSCGNCGKVPNKMMSEIDGEN